MSGQPPSSHEVEIESGAARASTPGAVRVRHPSDGTNEVVAFLDRELRNGAGFSVREEYPSVFDAYPGGESLICHRDGGVASHVAVLSREYLHPSFRLKIGLIGSVATAPAFRGQGVASSLLRESFAVLRARGAVLAVLWSDRPDFYHPLEFHRAGLEQSYRFDPRHVLAGSVDSASAPRPFEPSRDAASVWRLYGKQASRLDRSLEETKRLAKIPRLKLYVTESDGVVSSYVAIHKGADFENHVHEWAGDPSVVARSVAILQKTEYADRPLTVIGPAFYPMEAFRRLGGVPSRGALGLIKVLDRRALRATYLDYCKSLGLGAKWDEDLIVDGRRLRLTSEAEILRAVLGSDEDGVDLAFPPKLPFFLWGLDSI